MFQRTAEPSVRGSTSHRDEHDALFAIRLSLPFGLLMVLGKVTAYFMTHSAAIFSDAAESIA